MSPWVTHAVAVGFTVLTVALLWRRIESVTAITKVLWATMIVTVGLVIAIYDFLGYFTVAYMGDEIKQPGRVMPKAIVLSVLGVMGIYLVMNIGILGVMPVKAIMNSKFIGSDVMTAAWGRPAAVAVTILILITAFASVYTGLLGASRLPFNAARDGMFFRPFGKLHQTLRFPTSRCS